MIVIPMLGRSSRFFNAGYLLPKYKLPLGGETVFAKSVRSFEQYFQEMPFLFLIRKDHNAREFVSIEVEKLGLRDFRIIEFARETRGQAESVEIGTRDYDRNTPLLVFNIDTIRIKFEMPVASLLGDGFLEVFEGKGSGWSFVEPGDGNVVLRTAEKQRISNLCSNGLYYFKKLELFRRAYYKNTLQVESIADEVYIAPLYNDLIREGYDIRYQLVSPMKIFHCGIPEDYESVKSILN